MSDQAAVAAPVKKKSVKTRNKPRHAPRYRVLLHNDDKTPMDFVMAVLLRYFHKTQEEAFQLMWEAHTRDVSLVAVLPLEQAEFRVDQVHSFARPRKFPLTLTYEPEE